MGNPVIIHLIRHEQTKANLEKRYIGWTDKSIMIDNEQFQLPFSPKTVYGSDLKRCFETSKSYFPKAIYKSFTQLREINFGAFEMKTYEQLKENQSYRNWIDDPLTSTPPNGEQFCDFKLRVLECFLHIVNSPGEYVFVVHGGVIRVLLSIFSSNKESFQQIIVKHRTIYTMQWSDFKGGQKCESLLVEPIMVKETL